MSLGIVWKSCGHRPQGLEGMPSRKILKFEPSEWAFWEKNEVIELWWLQIWNESEKKLVYRPSAARSEPGNTKLIFICPS